MDFPLCFWNLFLIISRARFNQENSASTLKVQETYKKSMKRFILTWMVRLKGKFNHHPKRVDIDLVIEENMSLMKEIRMKRMRFYKFYKKAQSYC